VITHPLFSGNYPYREITVDSSCRAAGLQAAAIVDYCKRRENGNKRND